MKRFALSALFVALLSTGVLGDVTVTNVIARDDLPDYLRVEAKSAPDDMVEFVVSVDPDKAAHFFGDNLNKGQVSVAGLLHMATKSSTVAQVAVEADRDIHGRHRGDPVRVADDRAMTEKDDGQITYRFKMSSELARWSIFYVRTLLHEKDGQQIPGGGAVYRMPLSRFVPGHTRRSKD